MFYQTVIETGSRFAHLGYFNDIVNKSRVRKSKSRMKRVINKAATHGPITPISLELSRNVFFLFDCSISKTQISKKTIHFSCFVACFLFFFSSRISWLFPWLFGKLWKQIFFPVQSRIFCQYHCTWSQTPQSFQIILFSCFFPKQLNQN